MGGEGQGVGPLFLQAASRQEENGPLHLNPPPNPSATGEADKEIALLFPVDPKFPVSLVSVGRVIGR